MVADPLSDVLRVMRLIGGVFLHAEFTEPWCILSQAKPEDCEPLLPEVEHIILYHYVLDGHLVVQVENAPPLAVGAREAIVLPRNDVHRMGSHLDAPPVESHDIIDVASDGRLATISYGGGGACTRIVCGFLGCRNLQGNPLICALPALIHLDTRAGAAAEWIRVSFAFAADELAAGRPCTETLLAKLSEVLFVEAVRSYLENLPDEPPGWLAGLKDPFVGRCLALIHSRLAEPWTVDELARAVGLSRSALADRFARLIGEPPMHYLARWRLQVAAERLSSSHEPLARIAFDVGYESEVAFSRAFKRAFGSPPGTWRRRTEESRAAA